MGANPLPLPPVSDDGHAELPLCPRERVRVATLAGQKQRAKLRQVVTLQILAAIVFTLDGAKRGGRGEEHADLVLRDHAPERSRIRCSDGLAFVKARRVSVGQWFINDVGVTDGPAEIRSPPN